LRLKRPQRRQNPLKKLPRRNRQNARGLTDRWLRNSFGAIYTATKEQLEALPEIGPVKAQAIIDGRPYQKPEDVMKVKGIKEGTYGKIKEYITVR
jgi:ERCC4-type nuclease